MTKGVIVRYVFTVITVLLTGYDQTLIFKVNRRRMSLLIQRINIAQTMFYLYNK